MGHVTVARDADLRRIVVTAGGDPDKAEYDETLGALVVADVDDAALLAARDAVITKADTINNKDKKLKRKEMQRKALRKHEQTILAADSVYQQKKAEIAAAITLADLEAIDYP